MTILELLAQRIRDYDPFLTLAGIIAAGFVAAGVTFFALYLTGQL